MSGTVGDNLFRGSGVVKTNVTTYDDDPVVNDIATLALHQATNANAAKYNLVNTNVDQFEDSTGVATFTDCARDSSGEYVSTFSSNVEAFTADVNTKLLLHMDDVGLTDSSSAGHTMNITSGCARSDVQSKFGGYSAYFDYTSGNSLYPDASSDFALSTGDFTWEGWFYTLDTGPDHQSLIGYFPYAFNNHRYYKGSAAATTFYMGNTSAWSPVHGANLGGGEDVWHHMASCRDGDTVYCYKDGTTTSNTSVTGFDGTQTAPILGASDLNPYKGYMDEVRFSNSARYPGGTTFTPNLVETANATGNFVSTATTANASVSSMGGVITYTNTSGTATLNTDIILEVSANGGSNYTTATLEAGGTFATGILQTVANDISVTAGTSIQYRISFANQSDGSKETRINGVSLMY